MSGRDEVDLRGNRTKVRGSTAVDALAVFDDALANCGLLDRVECLANRASFVSELLSERFFDFVLDCAFGTLTFHLFGDGLGSSDLVAEPGLDSCEQLV